MTLGDAPSFLAGAHVAERGRYMLVIKQNSQSAPSRRRNLSVAAAAAFAASHLASLSHDAQAQISPDEALIWYASQLSAAPEPPAFSLLGDDRCAPSAQDCNPCIDDVEAQFREGLDERRMTWEIKHWNFDWDARYAPSELKARHPFDVEDKAIQKDGHVQGFVRTGIRDYPFAVTHSDDATGAVAIIAQDAEGRKSLKALHRTTSAHPGSLATIGKYVVLPDADHVRFVDVSRPTAPQDIHYALPGPIQISSDASGGVAMAKLRGGGHLLLFVTGGSNPDNRHTVFLSVTGPLEHPDHIEYLGSFPLKQTLSASPSSRRNWEGSQLPENTSLLTECGTGRLYTVHFGSGTASLEGDAAIHLARVDLTPSGPITTTVHIYSEPQDSDYCWFRGGASAGSHLDEPHTLRILCHERSRHLFTGAGDIFRFDEAINVR